MTWQPIAEAPKDTDILAGIWTEDGEWRTKVIWWPSSYGDEPTHWMPLPPPPVEE